MLFFKLFVSTLVIKPTIQWTSGPVYPKVRCIKRLKPTYSSKIRWELSTWKSFKAHLKKPECLVNDSLHGGPSRISSPPAGHFTAYGMFVMDNTNEIFIHIFPSFQIIYLSKG